MARRQDKANRINAKKSTGPRSANGKAASARNAIKHGLSGTLQLTAGESARWHNVRYALSDLMDNPSSREIDIDECATAQVLLERLIHLRHETHVSQAKEPGKFNGIEQLRRLMRFENQLTKRRDRVLALLDIDEYTNADSVLGVPQ